MFTMSFERVAHHHGCSGTSGLTRFSGPDARELAPVRQLHAEGLVYPQYVATTVPDPGWPGFGA